MDLKSFLLGIVGRLLTPPDLGPVDLPIAARLIPKARLTIEGACRGFFYAGVLQTLPLALFAMLVAFRLGQAWQAAKTYAGTLARLVLALIRSKIPPNDREPMP